jgi:Mg2+/Co2+ transporter CorC
MPGKSGFPGTPQEYHTLAGFIPELAGEIPQTGAIFDWNGYRFKVADMDGNRIDKMLIVPPVRRTGAAEGYHGSVPGASPRIFGARTGTKN